MKEKLKKLRQDFAAKDTELKGLLEKEALSAEEEARFEVLSGELKALKAEIEKLEQQLGDAEQLSGWAAAQPAATIPHAGGDPAIPAQLSGSGAVPYTPFSAVGGSPVAGNGRAYASPRRGGASNFQPRFSRKKNRFVSAEEQAYDFGMWFLATSLGRPHAQNYCRDNGIALSVVLRSGEVVQLAHSEGVNSTGGFLVPEEIDNALIDLREQYGVFRQYADVRRMRSDTRTILKRTGGLTAYPVGEGQAGTESTKGWTRVGLTAKKWMVLSLVTSELDEDSVVDMGNDLAGEIAYAFANEEDLCGFNGDGTSTYHTITGVRQALLNLSATIANIAGLVVAAGNNYSEIVLSDFNKVKARLPQYVNAKGRPCWFSSKGFYHEVMEKLALAAGGVTAAEIAAGRNQEFFMGYPVVIAQVLPSVEANSQVCALFGDLAMAATLGDRRQNTIAISEHAAYNNDETTIRGTTRYDINVHDVGNASATAGLRVPGPIVGLVMAAS